LFTVCQAFLKICFLLDIFIYLWDLYMGQLRYFVQRLFNLHSEYMYD
jgi:hypothetical protein